MIKPLIKQKAKKPIFRGDIILDGHEFKNATFVDANIVWNGGEFSFENVRFFGNVSFKTDDTKIASTISALKALGFLSQNFANSWTRDSK